MADMDAATIYALGNKLDSIEIVEPSPGAGFRVLLHMRSRHGTPVIETCSTIFNTLKEADTYAAAEYGRLDAMIRLDR